MARYLVRRVFHAILVVIGVTLVVFVFERLLPGGPARAVLGPHASQAAINQWLRQNGYTKPIPIQYIDYLGQLLRGDLGYSYVLNDSVASLIADRLPKTVVLMTLAYGVAFVVAVPLGMYQGARRNKVDDHLLTGVSLILYSMPVFWLGIILILFFSVHLGWLSAEAPQCAGECTIPGLLSDPSGLILPVLTLALVTIAYFSRYMRSAVLDNLVQEYVRTARAKGASRTRVLFRHVLRNTMPPLLTLGGLTVPAIFGGALIVESIFNYPGMGLLFYTSATRRDYPVLLGCTLIVSIATVVGSLLADVMYAVVDPRVRYTTE